MDVLLYVFLAMSLGGPFSNILSLLRGGGLSPYFDMFTWHNMTVFLQNTPEEKTING